MNPHAARGEGRESEPQGLAAPSRLNSRGSRPQARSPVNVAAQCPSTLTDIVRTTQAYCGSTGVTSNCSPGGRRAGVRMAEDIDIRVRRAGHVADSVLPAGVTVIFAPS